MRITTVRIRDNRVMDSYTHNSMTEAEQSVESLRVSGLGCTFCFENESGEVIKVVKK